MIFYQDPTLTLLNGDVRDMLRTLPDESVQCVVTSPPYWGLRDYGTAAWEGGDEGCDHKRGVKPARTFTNGQGGVFDSNLTSWTYRDATVRDALCPKGCGARRIDQQIGLEPSPEAWVAVMVDVFREVRRVLRRDGVVWLNVGDAYASAPPGNGKGFSPETTGLHGGRNSARYQATMNAGAGTKRNTVVGSLKPKDLIGLPWMLAFALRADGWYLRSDIVWHKPNPMPESVTDRPTKAHEYVFLLTRSPRYFYDADAVREPSTTTRPELLEFNDRPDVGGTGHMNDRRIAKRPDGWASHKGGHGSYHRNGREAGAPAEIPSGRNLRDVWTIATEPYPEAHFATFPQKLVEPCIKAGTSERGCCPECGAPWARVVELTVEYKAVKARQREIHGPNYHMTHAGLDAQKGKGSGTNPATLPPMSRTIGWRPTCDHDVEPVPCTVLDPFGGSGTTALVANRLGRRAVLIELNPDYCAQAQKRCRSPWDVSEV